MKVIQAKRVARQAKKVGRIIVKPVDMAYVEAMSNGVKFGLNVHACGKIEFFRDSMYTLPKGPEFDAMMAIAKGV